MFKFLLPAAAAVTLGAFAVQSQSADATTEAVAPAMGWHMSHDGRMAKLAYGVANSDQLALMLTCSPGERTAVAYGDVRVAGARLMQASMAPAELDPMTGEPEMRVALADPALQALATRGSLAVEGEAGAARISASKDERRLVGDFLAYCGAERA